MGRVIRFAAWVAGRKERGRVAARAEKMEDTPRRYVCAKCGEPVNPKRCWIGNEGLLCRKHALVWRVEKGQLDGDEKSLD